VTVQDPSIASDTTTTPTTVSGPAAGDVFSAETRPMRTEVWRRFRRNRMAMAGLIFLVLLCVAAIFAPLITRYSPTERVPQYRQGPSTAHWFGTDAIGRDMFARVIYGARVSLKIGFTATAMTIVIGLLIGATSGFFGGWIDTALMRVTDVFLAIPYIVLAIAIATVFGRSVNSVIVVLGLTSWLGLSRIVRASFLSLKQQEYVEAARALGYSRTRVVFRHILPNALQPIIVYGTIAVGSVILAEAALSFLGVGPQDPTPSWGLMVSQGKGDVASAFHLLAFPGGAICLTVLAFVLIGDGLRDALDPKLR
jgi:peptide/nickel transport system permease protein